MIRYPYDAAQVAADILDIDRRWFLKAQHRAAAIIALGRYAEASSIWSDIKPVFMRLQRNKCIYCERQFENPEYGTIEFDLEHFRPKSTVSLWPNPERHAKLQYQFSTGAQLAAGYYWLAYDLLNYAASCKICNTIFKLDFFPVAAERAPPGSVGEQLTAEQSFLCYPIGAGDTDPEELVTFDLTTAIPAHGNELEHRRGKIVIDFFGLNLREQLHVERARMISLIAPLLSVQGEKLVMNPALPHAACLRAFCRLWQNDRARAEIGLERCRAIALGEIGGL